MSKVDCFDNADDSTNDKEEVIIDFGSGSTKFKKIIFDQNESRWKVVSEISIAIPHQRCLEESQGEYELSEKCIAEGAELIGNGLKHIHAECNVITCVGIATAWARVAKNKEEYFSQIKNTYQISKVVTLTHQQEAAIGFMSSIPFLRERNPGTDLSKIIIWDIGGGSFQQVAVRAFDRNVTDFSYILNDKRALHANLEPWGSVNFAHNLYEHLGIDNTSRLLHGEEVDRASEYAKNLFKELNSTSIAERIKDPECKVYAIGEFMNKGFLPFNSISEQLTLDGAHILRVWFKTQSEGTLCLALKSVSPTFDCGNLRMIETNLLLITAIMEGIGLASFSFLPDVSVVGAVDYINRLIEGLYEDPNTVG